MPASPQNPVLASRSAHRHIMHPEPQHLKNFARASQWMRGKKVLKSAFFTRFHRPGFERLLACHTFIHLMRTIGHHIDRLACRSVNIMGCLPAQQRRFFPSITAVPQEARRRVAPGVAARDWRPRPRRQRAKSKSSGSARPGRAGFACCAPMQAARLQQLAKARARSGLCGNRVKARAGGRLFALCPMCDQPLGRAF